MFQFFTQKSKVHSCEVILTRVIFVTTEISRSCDSLLSEAQHRIMGAAKAMQQAAQLYALGFRVTESRSTHCIGPRSPLFGSAVRTGLRRYLCLVPTTSQRNIA